MFELYSSEIILF